MRYFIHPTDTWHRIMGEWMLAHIFNSSVDLIVCCLASPSSLCHRLAHTDFITIIIIIINHLHICLSA